MIRIRYAQQLTRSLIPFCIAIVMIIATSEAQAQSSTPAESPSKTIAPLELVVLGSGGPGATGRAGACYLVLLNGVPRIFVDAGPGCFARLGEAKLSVADADIVLLTHLHIDHTGELPGLFKARAVSSGEAIQFNVFGPDGRRGNKTDATFPSTSRFIDLLFGPQGAFSYLHDFSAPMTIKATNVATTVMRSSKPVVLVKENGLVISALAGHHRDAPAVIYRIDYAGKSITFSGDIDAAGLPNLRKIASGTDLLVFNSVVLDPPESPEILYTLHTPPHTIGEIARDVGTKNLLLSHLSPAVDRAADEVRAAIAQNYSGPIVFAQDGMHVTP